MRKPKRFYVYIMTNRSRSHVLYTGITGNLHKRVFQHKNKLVKGFTSRYNLTRLVYYEQFVYPDAAIAREGEIKGWRRSKKIRLIESTNPHWHDLADAWTEIYRPDSLPVRQNHGPERPEILTRPKSSAARNDAGLVVESGNVRPQVRSLRRLKDAGVRDDALYKEERGALG